MRKKHPTLGKRTLAKMYFIRPDKKVDPEIVEESSPMVIDTKEKYLKMKNYK